MARKKGKAREELPPDYGNIPEDCKSLCIVCMQPVISAVSPNGDRGLLDPVPPENMPATVITVKMLNGQLIGERVPHFMNHVCDFYKKREAERIRYKLVRDKLHVKPALYDKMNWLPVLREISDWDSIKCPRCGKPSGEMCRNMSRKDEVPVKYPHDARCYEALAKRGFTVVTNRGLGYIEVYPPSDPPNKKKR